MKKVFDFLFSMQFSGILMLLFAAAIGTATFVENDLGTLASKLLVYEAFWFELLMLLMAISMLGGIFKYNLYKRKKLSVLIFHISFVIILIGSAITRYAGTEGIMRIREGNTSNEFISENSFINVNIIHNGQTYKYEKKKMFTPYTRNTFDQEIKFGNESCQLSLIEYYQNAAETIVEEPNGHPIISFVSMGTGERETVFLQQGELKMIAGQLFSFESANEDPNIVQVKFVDGGLKIKAPFEIGLSNMSDESTTMLNTNEFHPFNVMKLYVFGDKQLVIKAFYPTAKVKMVSVPVNPNQNASNGVAMKLEFQGNTEEVVLFGGKGYITENTRININGTQFELNYGSKLVKLPFSLYLRDFILDRYPGSMSPSSFASEVTLIDERVNLREDRRIFMNNILNYGGYRFFQAQYDKDEKGTVLSVNQDTWGTNVTYFGYLIMALGMLFNFFHKNSRFRNLMLATSKKAKTIALIIVFTTLGMLSTETAQAQMGSMPPQSFDPTNAVHPDHANEFGKLLVLDSKGRIEPINTLSSEILLKVTKKAKFMGLNPNQVFIGMISNPVGWQTVPMIKISDSELKKLLGIKGNYASFNDFLDFSKGGSYKLGGLIDQAYKKKPASRSGYDKEIIKVDERVNICYMVYMGDFLKIFPLKNDANNSWVTNKEVAQFDSIDGGFVSNILPLYYGSLQNGIQSGNWAEATQNLSYIKTFQKKFGSEVFPSATKIKLEVLYNNVNIFKRLFPYFSTIGFIMLILLFMNLLNPKYKFKKVIKLGIILIAIGFAFQTLGLAVRWYISGHAPMSDGYESMIFIAWATVLGGLFFVKTSKITVAITAILASLALMVANLSWLNPEITNLVPVLKSYWLSIHVSVITASYSFLAIGALLGFFNLLLMILKKPANKARLDTTIKELTNINEMNLIIGGFLLTIGTFLGAVWANESWGRYWGWDPKETWALVSVVVYAFVVHMRLTPGLKGTYTFNFAALISFGAILMTYFGVNYYLSGMHSYAQGDPVPVPTFVYYMIVIIAVVSVMAYRNEKKYKPLEKKK